MNDQPSDKAYYDFTLSVPAPRVGIANGELVSRHRRGRRVLTRFHLDKPASSYLTTVEFGRYRLTRLHPVAGTPLVTWTPRGDATAKRKAAYLSTALRWVERRLGPFPFASLSLVFVKGYVSGMENQTLITMGDDRYDTARVNLVHEVVHQWYGDTVTPADWRDVWMNEGMAMYLQDIWQAHSLHQPLEQNMAMSGPDEAYFRAVYGPPGNYHPSVFAAPNIYLSPALMWDQLRRRVGDGAFWSMVRAWPGVHRYGNATRSEYLGWIEHRLHQRLGGFFHAWLMGKTTPPIH